MRNDKMDDNNVQNSLCITSMKQELSGPTEAHGPFIFVFVKFSILNLKKNNFNFKKFKSSFSQNLSNNFFSILAYSFLGMNFMN